MISYHHLTGFWFESGVAALNDAEQESASQFLTAAIDALSSNPTDRVGELKGAIHTNYDPLLLNTSWPGHLWLGRRLSWMKQTFPSFDDEPGVVVADPAQRRSPFPAFHWSRYCRLDNRPLPLEGVQVLIGHDFVVIHEFRALLSEWPSEVIFAQSPPTTLFTAVVSQRSALAKDLNSDWPVQEFAVGRCPGLDIPLRVALRGTMGRYDGQVLVETKETSAYGQAKIHLYANAYQTFLCTLLVNGAKVESEFDIAHDAVDRLTENLSKQLPPADPSEVSVNSRSTLGDPALSHDATQRALYHFDQLALTCQINLEQFEHVSEQLLEVDNTWIKTTRRRLRAYNDNLRQTKKSTWQLFEKVEPQLIPPAKSRIRDQIFISYSHEDAEWLADLKVHLDPYVRKFNEVGLDESMVWDDSRIKAGDDWQEKIKEALDRARAAIFLVSPDFLASKFINKHELPELLKAQKSDGLLFCWIHVRSSSYKETVFNDYQALNNPSRPLQHFRTRRDEEWVKICEKFFEIIGPSATPRSNKSA